MARFLNRMPDFSKLGDQLKNRNRHMKLVTRNTIPWTISCETDNFLDDPITREDAFNMFNINWKDMRGDEGKLHGYMVANLFVGITSLFVFTAILITISTEDYSFSGVPYFCCFL